MRELWHDLFGHLGQNVFDFALRLAQVEGDVGDPCSVQGTHVSSESIAADAAPELDRPEGRVGIRIKVQMHGGQNRRGGKARIVAGLTPHRQAAFGLIRRTGIGEPAVQCAGDPLQALLAHSGHDHRDALRHIGAHGNGALRPLQCIACPEVAHLGNAIAQGGSAGLIVEPHERVFHRTVARRDTKDKPPARQMVQAGRHLGQQDRIAQRQDDTGSAKRNAPRAACKKAEIGKRVENLPCIPEARIVNRHVPQPDGIKAKALGQFHALGGGRDVRHAEGAAFDAGAALPGFSPVAIQWQFNAKAHAVFADQF
ncbi:hypothetical protein SAMN05444959_1393 [Paracoccus seriniphilus]|uniref:Uncharacterized protein n=1 Tax=Paracoccus seriniphilus TaxID=184748 RepID=A0A239Q342_9RHOB|nr:hypothetical protein SAMN05444959_1393 [Paracoccus seriniphilus]